MESIKVLNLDFRGISNIIQTLKAVQHDDGRAVRVMLSGTQGNISKVRIYCQKPSGMETYTDGTVVNDYCVLFGLTPQMLAEEGVVKSQLQLMDGEHVVTSFDFQIQVSKNRIASSSITSSNEYQALVEALKNVDKTETEISQNRSEILEIKGRVGTAEQNIDVHTAQIAEMQKIPEGGTTADAALNDIKIGYDGTEYPTPGEAVRGQIGSLFEEIYIKDTILKKQTKGKIAGSNTSYLFAPKKFFEPNEVGKLMLVSREDTITSINRKIYNKNNPPMVSIEADDFRVIFLFLENDGTYLGMYEMRQSGYLMSSKYDGKEYYLSLATLDNSEINFIKVINNLTIYENCEVFNYKIESLNFDTLKDVFKINGNLYPEILYGGWHATNDDLRKIERYFSPDRVGIAPFVYSKSFEIKVPEGYYISAFFSNDDDEYLESLTCISDGNYMYFSNSNCLNKKCYISVISTSGNYALISDLIDKIYVKEKIKGKNVLIYRFGGEGNDWCFVRTPENYDETREIPYPFVICNHGNGWIMDGTEKFANWTKRTMYLPIDDPDYLSNPEQYNGTMDSSLWYSNPTIEKLLSEGFIVCGCENYGDNLYGNDKCRTACVDFYYHMILNYNVEKRCCMIGASNGALTTLNACYLLGNLVKSVILQYPLVCLWNQFNNYTPHRQAIAEAYGIDVTISENEFKKLTRTHDPLYTSVVNDIKVEYFPPIKIWYSEYDTVTKAEYNSVPFLELLENSNLINESIIVVGEHGDYRHFDPDKYCEWFKQ